MAQQSDPSMLALPRSFNAFGLRLFGQLAGASNAFYSPLSVSAALTALFVGARGDTAREMAAVLGLDDDPQKVAEEMAVLRHALEPRRIQDEPGGGMRDSFSLTLANALFVEEGYALQTDYCDLLEDLGSDLFSTAFQHATQAAERINGWVTEKTAGRIRDLVSPDVLHADTRTVLANAIYFKGRWVEVFSEGATSPRPFHLLPGSDPSTVDVPMMRKQDTYRYWREARGGLEALWIPYEGGLSMLVLLPAIGQLEEAQSKLSAELVARVSADAKRALVDLVLPRFELRSSFLLRQALHDLGLNVVFDRLRADFTGISPHREVLSLGEVLHQAWVKVDEEGTEAAAATAVMVLGAAMVVERPRPIPFIVDRPFLFAIRDERTGAVLFVGRVVDPS